MSVPSRAMMDRLVSWWPSSIAGLYWALCRSAAAESVRTQIQRACDPPRGCFGQQQPCERPATDDCVAGFQRESAELVQLRGCGHPEVSGVRRAVERLILLDILLGVIISLIVERRVTPDSPGSVDEKVRVVVNVRVV